MPFLRLLCVVLLATAACTAQLSYSTRTYVTARGPVEVVAADFNRDGRPDIATVGFDFGTVDVHLWSATDEYGGTASYGAMPNAAELDVCDCNADGYPDLLVRPHATATAPARSVGLLLNTGNGTFAAMRTIALTGEPKAVAVGYLYGDAYPDLVVAQADALQAYYGNGDGTFRNGPRFSTGFFTEVFIADLNKDGLFDIAAQKGGPAIVTVVQTGTTSFRVTETPSSGAGDWAAADFNGDQAIDLAVGIFIGCGHGEGSCEPFVDLYRNNTDGTFTYERRLWIGTGSIRVFADDLNGDEKADLAVTSEAGVQLAYALGNGDGTFGAAAYINVPNTPRAVAVRDLNRDGRPDLAVLVHGAETVHENTLAVMLNSGGAQAGCAPAGTANHNVKICTPAEGAGASSPVRVSAAAYAPADIERMEVWLDGKKRAERLGVEQIQVDVPASTGTHSFVVQSRDAFGNLTATRRSVTVGSSSTCTPSSTPRTVTICAPADGATVSSPVHISAAAQPGSTAVSRMNVWVDGVKKNEVVSTTRIEVDVAMSPGTRRVTVQAADSQGTFRKTIYITVSGSSTSCPAPSTAGTVSICSPQNNSTSGSPVRVSATAKPRSGYSMRRMEVWVDGVKKYELQGASAIDTNIGMAAGTRRVTVQGVDSGGGLFKGTVYVTVQ